jgi:hypothetical protein
MISKKKCTFDCDIRLAQKIKILLGEGGSICKFYVTTKIKWFSLVCYEIT